MTLLKSSGSGQGLMKGTEQRYTGLQSVAAFLKSDRVGLALEEKQAGEGE